jgi:hypothetical protein
MRSASSELTVFLVYIAHRTGLVAGATLPVAAMLPRRIAAQTEKREAVPRSAGSLTDGGTHPRRCPLRGRAPSGGIIDAVRFRVRSLYPQGAWKMSHSESAISRGRKQTPADGTTDAENGRGEGVEPDRARRANCGGLKRRDERRREVPRKTTRTRRRMPSTNGHANQWRERNWLPK